MNWIEIMGPSGIGKSTFNRIFVKQRGPDEKWVVPSEARLEVAKRSEQRKIQKKLLQRILNQRLVKVGDGMLIKYLLNPRSAYLQEAHKYVTLIQNKMDHHFEANKGDGVEIAYRISLFKSIIEDMCLLDYHNYQKPVLMEVGPYNHSIKFNSFSKGNIPQSCLPTAFIFCHLDLQTNLERLKIRERKGKTVPLHRNLDDNQLKILVTHKQQLYLDKVRFLKTLPVPNIDIDLKEDHLINVAKVKAFFRTIL